MFVRVLLATTAAILALSAAPGQALAQGGSVYVGPRMRAHAVDMAVSGDIRCRDMVGRRCRGHLSAAPIELVVRRRATVDIEIDWSNIDTVLALVGPSGTFSDNNGGRGDLSRIRAVLDPGVHYLYVGTRHRRHRGVARVVIDGDWPPAPVVIAPPRRAPPRVVVVPPPRPDPRVIVVYEDDDDDDHRRRRGRRGRHGRHHHDD